MAVVRDVVQRDLDEDIQSVVKVTETDRLMSDLKEYVLTELLAKQFADVFGPVVGAARPAGSGSHKVGIWVSGFFGSGKSYFAKLIGHMAANTSTAAGPARDVFGTKLKPGNQQHDRLAELLHEARTHNLRAFLVPFDIAATYGDPNDSPARIALRAFQSNLGLSTLIAYAERELELIERGMYDRFLQLYQARATRSWSEDKDLSTQSYEFAACLAELGLYPSAEVAHDSLNMAIDQVEKANVKDVVARLLRWLDKQAAGPEQRTMVFFVADEVGAWAGRNLDRIEQVRALVQQFEEDGQGRLWLLATSQERLSDVVQNAGVLDAKSTREFIQRLEARFQVNVHLEPSEVGVVIENRVLQKRPDMRKDLEALFRDRQATILDAAGLPGLELLGQYPNPTEDDFVKDYPFLPYQLPLAADIFGGMRGVKVSSGARSMLKVSLETTRKLAARPLGAVASWDLIFDAANGENEFADENYLGTPGLQRLSQADKDFDGKVPFERPSRILKTLWLAQQTNRIPCTVGNLARLLLDRLDGDVLDLEQRIEKTLQELRHLDYVRRDPASGQWRFLTPDEVTVEKIVSRIAAEIPAKAVRDAIHELYAARLKSFGKVQVGASSTLFTYQVALNDVPLVNDGAPVRLEAWFEKTPRAKAIADEHAAYVTDSTVHWVLPAPDQLMDRLRRVLAIERLTRDDEFNRIKTASTLAEAEKLGLDASETRQNIEKDVSRAVASGTLYYGGGSIEVEGSGRDFTSVAKSRIEDAIKDRIAQKYPRFKEGDKRFDARNIDRLLDTPAPQRAKLDPELGLFDDDGHVKKDSNLVAALTSYLGSSPKTSGADIADHFGAPEYGWPRDLMRYVAVAMFVDGQVALISKAGKRFDDPKSAGARTIVGQGEFKSTRVDVEENPLTPAEVSALRTLLQDLGHKTTEASELALHEALRSFTSTTATRMGAMQRAQQVNLPLPVALDPLQSILDEVNAAASRSTALRTALSHGDRLRAGIAALAQLQTFITDRGIEQFQRSERLMEAALHAGLLDDPKVGSVLREAQKQLQEIKAQRRVLDDWTGPYEDYRAEVIDAYRSVYAPLHEQARVKTDTGRAEVEASDEYRRLKPEGELIVRREFFGRGQALEEILEVSLKTEEDLLSATSAHNIALLRAKRDGTATAIAQALARAAELGAATPADAPATWPSSRLSGRVLKNGDDADKAFDAAKGEVKALLKQGKTVRIV